MKLPKFLGSLIFYLTLPGINLIVRGSTRAYVVIEFEDSVLVVKNWLGRQGLFRLPGGGVHKRETTIEGAIREVHEEVGISLESKDIKAIGDPSYHLSKGYDICLFRVTLKKEPNIKPSELEIIEAKFIPKKILNNDLKHCGEELLIALKLV